MMARADVFALPSAPEGFGLVHLEAMTQGTPVIGCLDQGPADFIEDGVSGYLVPYGDVGALTRALAATLDDPARARAVGESGPRRVAEAFTWERNARRMLETLRAVRSATARGRRVSAAPRRRQGRTDDAPRPLPRPRRRHAAGGRACRSGSRTASE